MACQTLPYVVKELQTARQHKGWYEQLIYFGSHWNAILHLLTLSPNFRSLRKPFPLKRCLELTQVITFPSAKRIYFQHEHSISYVYPSREHNIPEALKLDLEWKSQSLDCSPSRLSAVITIAGNLKIPKWIGFCRKNGPPANTVR